MAFSDIELSASGPSPTSVSIQPRPVGTTPTGAGGKGWFEVGPSVEPRGAAGPEFDLPDAELVAP